MSSPIEEATHEKLCGLTPAQFEDVIRRIGVTEGGLPDEGAPRADRARALIDLCAAREGGGARLMDATAESLVPPQSAGPPQSPTEAGVDRQRWYDNLGRGISTCLKATDAVLVDLRGVLRLAPSPQAFEEDPAGAWRSVVEEADRANALHRLEEVIRRAHPTFEGFGVFEAAATDAQAHDPTFKNLPVSSQPLSSLRAPHEPENPPVQAASRARVMTRLEDRYEFGEPLGRGGYGTVYRATERATGRSVAVKVVRLEPERFERCVAVLGKVDHPNIVKLYDSGDAEFKGILESYMVFELVDGQSLGRRIQHQGALSVEATSEILFPVMEGLLVVHSKDFIHRDVKPDNIVLRPTGQGHEGVLVDFDIVRDLQAIATQGKVMGTPLYLSPEQAKAGHPGPWTDVWAMALVFYECISGALPWKNRLNPWGLLTEIGTEGPITPLVDAMPEGARDPAVAAVSRVLERALVRDTRHRLPDIRALCDALEEALREEPWFSRLVGRLKTMAAPHSDPVGASGIRAPDPASEGDASAGVSTVTPNLRHLVALEVPHHLLISRRECLWRRRVAQLWEHRAYPPTDPKHVIFYQRDAATPGEASTALEVLVRQLRSRYLALSMICTIPFYDPVSETVIDGIASSLIAANAPDPIATRSY